jgi:hypothetical protein
LVKAIVKREAATRTLEHFGTPLGSEGQEARNALVMQQSTAAKDVADFLSDALKNAQVFQGGGQALEDDNTLEEKLRKAAVDGAARLFHKFAAADASGWPQAYQDAARGLVNALEKVGHKTPAETHPVALELLTHMGAGALKGAKLSERFTGAPYGWSHEAVMAALAALFACGQLKVSSASGQALVMGKFLERDFKHYAFERENTPLSIADKRAIARLAQCRPDDAEIEAPRYVATLKDTCNRIAGPAPRPAATLPDLLDELDKLTGKDLVKRLSLEEKSVQQLAQDLQAQAAKVQVREPRWADLTQLMAYLGDDDAVLRAERQAVLDGRLLLAEPDPVPDLLHRASDVLRSRLNTTFAAYASAFQSVTDALAQQADWRKLPAPDQASIRAQLGLAAAQTPPAVGTLQDLLAALAQCTPQRWGERQDALGGKLQQALAACAKKLEPTVQPYAAPARMVRNKDELDAWLAEVRQAVLTKLHDGPVQF